MMGGDELHRPPMVALMNEPLSTDELFHFAWLIFLTFAIKSMFTYIQQNVFMVLVTD